MIVSDATFFGRRRDKFGVVVFKDIIWKHIESKTIKDYNYLKHALLRKGFIIKGIFTQLKKLTKLHQGMTKSLKSKLIDDYLVFHNKKI